MDEDDGNEPSAIQVYRNTKRKRDDASIFMKEATSALMAIAQKTSPPPSPLPPPPKCKSVDEQFRETVPQLMGKIAVGVSKDILKLEIQTRHNYSNEYFGCPMCQASQIITDREPTSARYHHWPEIITTDLLWQCRTMFIMSLIILS